MAKSDIRTFDYPGYPKFHYFLIEDDYLRGTTATAIPKHGEEYVFGKPEEHYILVIKGCSPNETAMSALHEYHELVTGSHYQATRAERAFAKKFGMRKEYYGSKSKMARLMVSWSTLSRESRNVTGNLYYPTLVDQIVKQTGLSRGEVQRAIKPLVQEMKRQRIHLKHVEYPGFLRKFGVKGPPQIRKRNEQGRQRDKVKARIRRGRK